MSRDLRRYARQTNLRLIAGGLILLFVVGDGLIFLIWGPGAGMMGLLCLAGGLVPIILIVLILWFFEWMVKRADRE